MIAEEYWILIVPFLFALLGIFYFIYHMKHSDDYSDYVLEKIAEKIEKIKEEDIESARIKKIVSRFLKIMEDRENEKNIHLFDIERELGIDMASLEKKVDQILHKKYEKKNKVWPMNHENENLTPVQKIKKEIFQQLALSIFGNLVAKNMEGNIITKNMYFVSEPSGDLYLFARKNEELAGIDYSQEVFFCIFKEENIASEIKEIKVQGKIKKIETDSSEWQKGLSLFDEKSPFISNLPWIDNKENYQMYFLEVSKLYYQSIKEERAGKTPLFFVRDKEKTWKS